MFNMSFYQKISVVFLITTGFFVADRIFKFLFLGDWLNSFFSFFKMIEFHFFANYGIAFGWPINKAFIIILSSFLIIFIGGWLLNCLKQKDFYQSTALILVLFGAISNLIDRLLYGFVIDYIGLKYFTIFNLADVLITLGVILLLIDYLWYNNKNIL